MLQAKYKCDWSAIHSGCTNRMGNACLISAVVSYLPRPIGENTGLTAHRHAKNAKAVIRAAGQIIMTHFRSARMERPNEKISDGWPAAAGKLCGG
jgi:hypothetical protein